MVRLYAYSFLSGLNFTWTTWMAFVVARGGNPGWGESAFHLAILLGEIPTGVFADLLGRKRSILVGLGVQLLMPIGYLWIHDTVSTCAVMALSGLALTFLSGADTALLYDTAQEMGGRELAEKALARSSALQLAAGAIAPAAAGFLYQWSDYGPVMATCITSAAAILVLWTIPEREHPGDHKEQPASVWDHTQQALQTVRYTSGLPLLMVFGWVYDTFTALTAQFAQIYLPYTGFSMAATGLLFAAGQWLATGGSVFAERLHPKMSRLAFRFLPLVLGTAYLGMGRGGLWNGALWFGVGQALDGLLYPIHQARLNAQVPADRRATILSLQSAGFSLLMVAAFPAASYLKPITTVYTVSGTIALLLALMWIRVAPVADRA